MGKFTSLYIIIKGELFPWCDTFLDDFAPESLTCGIKYYKACHPLSENGSLGF
jgi:hypothetical protein